jgi:O-methyltransferase involved in polyketide biosynthesis
MSSTATKLTGVPRTMLLTTRARVDEHQRQDGLFRDPVVADWWQFLSWDNQLNPFYTPLAQFTWANRAHLIDRMVQDYLEKHKQAIVVELGAGLSTRYYRIGQDCQYWFELDLPEVTELRRNLDSESDRHRFISHSALDFNWMEELPPTNPEQILFIAEGLLMYFESAQVKQLIEQLNQRFPGATFIFDVVGGITKGKTAKFLASIGAPLQWFVNQEKDLSKIGLTLIEVRSLIEDNYRYPHRLGWYRWLGWLKGLPAFRNASLIVATRCL